MSTVFPTLLSFRPSEAVSRARGEIRAHSARQKGVDHAMRLDFSTALEMTGRVCRPLYEPPSVDRTIQLDFSTALEMTGWVCRPTLYEPPFSKGGDGLRQQAEGGFALKR